jgi:hypothetical protein
MGLCNTKCYKEKLMLRIFSIIFLLITAFISPSYLVAIMAVILIFVFNNYIEAVFFGLLLDILYSGNTVFGFHFKLFFFVLLGLIYLISPKIKKMLKFYSL